ncbi:MAG TPA: Xaa-Pro peptidase family protein [Stellaceae bacterium]|nr:Xaa-Pro peptidase family protein [Stellaceae bacterium]
MQEYLTTAADRPVTLRFPREEHDARIAATRALLREEGLDALLVFAQESHLYLTGYDTAGYVFFQCGMVTAAAGPLLLLTRRPDLAQALDASLYDDVQLWFNAEGADPARDVARMLADLGLLDSGQRLGIELATYGLTAANFELLRAALRGRCELVDASHVVRGLRLVKSPAELVYVRRAAALADNAVLAMIGAARPGALDSSITAAGVTAMLEGGGDMPAGGPLVNSGPRAIYGRGIGGARRLTRDDQIVVELGASYCRYNCCIEHSIVLGAVNPAQQRMFDVAADALSRVIDAARPGTPIGALDDIHRAVLDKGGYARARFSACGYSLGATFRPTWMDVPPMIYSGNPLPLRSGMVLFCHIMIGDGETGLAAGVGQSFVITEAAPENLSTLPVVLNHPA